MPERKERHGSELGVELLKKIRDSFAEELDKRASKSPTWRKILGPNIGERIICGERAPRVGSVEGLLAMIAQDCGIVPDNNKEAMKKIEDELLG